MGGGVSVLHFSRAVNGETTAELQNKIEDKAKRSAIQKMNMFS